MDGPPMTPSFGSRFTRRRLLAMGGAAGIAAASSAGVIAWSRGGRADRSAQAGGATVAPVPTATALSPSPSAAPGRRGGSARVTAPASFNFDTFDAQRAGDPTVAEVLGRTHSRLVTYGAPPDMALSGDLAQRWESPDGLTLIFHLDPAARWQARAPIEGARVSAADVVAHFSRMLALAADGKLPMAQRGSEYAAVRRVTSPGEGIVTFELASPAPLLLDTVAGRFALVQSPRAVDAFEAAWPKLLPEAVVGSGPFMFEKHDGGGLTFVAHPAAHRRANLDSLLVHEPGGDIEAFIAGKVDEVLTRDRRDAARVRSASAGALELPRFEDSAVMSSFFVGAPPWDNLELVKAISGALNRGKLGQALFGGRSAASGPVGPATPAYALTDSELAAYPGYRTDAAADAADARARWLAAGGAALGPITVDVPNIFDPLYSAGATLTAMLHDVLGNEFRPAVETYTTISAKAGDGRYGNGRAAFWFGWGPPLDSPDPTRGLIEQFDARSATCRALGVRSAGLEAGFDALLAATGAEKGLQMRALSGRLLAQGSAVVPWLLQRSELFRAPTLHAAAPSPFWPRGLDAESWRE